MFEKKKEQKNNKKNECDSHGDRHKNYTRYRRPLQTVKRWVIHWCLPVAWRLCTAHSDPDLAGPRQRRSGSAAGACPCEAGERRIRSAGRKTNDKKGCSIIMLSKCNTQSNYILRYFISKFVCLRILFYRHGQKLPSAATQLRHTLSSQQHKDSIPLGLEMTISYGSSGCNHDLCLQQP